MGISRESVKETVRNYLAAYPDEHGRCARFLSFLEKPHDYFDRKNFDGHITASGVILSKDGAKTLFVGHRFLERYLQPGGHIEAGATVIENAIREINEETAIPTHALRLIGSAEHPFDIDSHEIPGNPGKREDSHIHFDFRYLFRLTENVDLAPQEKEVTDLRWFGLSDPAVCVAIGPLCLKKALSMT